MTEKSNSQSKGSLPEKPPSTAPGTLEQKMRYRPLLSPGEHEMLGTLITEVSTIDEDEPVVFTQDENSYYLSDYLYMRDNWVQDGFQDSWGNLHEYPHRLRYNHLGLPKPDIQVQPLEAAHRWQIDRERIEKSQQDLLIYSMSGDKFILPGMNFEEEERVPSWSTTENLAELLRQTYPENDDLQAFPFKLLLPVIRPSPKENDEPNETLGVEFIDTDITHLDSEKWEMLLDKDQDLEEINILLVYLTEDEIADLKH